MFALLLEREAKCVSALLGDGRWNAVAGAGAGGNAVTLTSDRVTEKRQNDERPTLIARADNEETPAPAG